MAMLLALKPLFIVSIISPLVAIFCFHSYALCYSALAHPKSYLPILVVVIGNLVMLLIGGATGMRFPHPLTAILTAVLVWIINISSLPVTSYLTAFLRASPMAVINAVPTFATLLTSITILLFFAFLATSSILNKVELQFLSRVSIGLASLMGIVSILVAPPIWRWY